MGSELMAPRIFERNTSPPKNPDYRGWAEAEIRVHPTSVYVAFDRSGRCLYVGVTKVSQEDRRLKTYFRHSHWWSEVRSMSIYHFSRGDIARDVEAFLCRQLHPLFTKMVIGDIEAGRRHFGLVA